MSEDRIINLHFLTILKNTLEEIINFCKEIKFIPKHLKCPNCSRMLLLFYQKDT